MACIYGTSDTLVDAVATVLLTAGFDTVDRSEELGTPYRPTCWRPLGGSW
jgi:hypothetical protein